MSKGRKGSGKQRPAAPAPPPDRHHLRRQARQTEYRVGVETAVAALIDDLPGVEYDDDGRSVACCACVLRAHAFDLLATVWEEAVGAAPHGRPEASA
ncbi:hypothetical protein CcI49_06770 [Frankia sp. CcI49]|uniref:hypothetical protein n=1 Tax=Frankia sp. CcI49 TaxID=1745382 RepID=UPI000977D75E|nr:hypothetical protein [Frankia sp. CcI49]ONH61286.1 hypothetical protein CcI49_06770 [Frankia sp. CcI49]